MLLISVLCAGVGGCMWSRRKEGLPVVQYRTRGRLPFPSLPAAAQPARPCRHQREMHGPRAAFFVVLPSRSTTTLDEMARDTDELKVYQEGVSSRA